LDSHTYIHTHTHTHTHTYTHTERERERERYAIVWVDQPARLFNIGHIASTGGTNQVELLVIS